MLHPPSSTCASVPEYDVASGCVFLPGLPHLGLEHRAAWVEADVEGNVTQLVNKVGVDPQGNVDTAALALLLAAWGSGRRPEPISGYPSTPEVDR